MLLLVLILILIAFGLLVIALFTGSVVWAWVSVAVSAVAALVLVVDHLQRRAAVRAGRVSAETPGGGLALEPESLETEPVTEILPVVQRPANRPDQYPDQHRSGEQDAERLPVSDQGPPGQRTESVQSRGPSGSDERPPGAAGAPPPPPGDSSPSVTTSGGDEPADRGMNQPTVVASAPADPSGPPEGGVRPSDPTVHGVAPADLPAGAAGAEPVAEDVEPPEESRDNAVAALVAQLPDEVVVVDEQPRYHLGNCRALTARAVIPLPVQEAVELGFTPCGWCGPDRALAERHPARAQ